MAICDRGYRGLNQVGDTQILIPKPPKKKDTPYQRLMARLRFRRRAAIEPVIGHLKHDHRMARSYLKGAVGDAIKLVYGRSGVQLQEVDAEKWDSFLRSWRFCSC